MQETEKSRGCVKPRVCTRNIKVSKWGQLLKYADTNQPSYFAEEETRHRALLPGDPHGVTCSECTVKPHGLGIGRFRPPWGLQTQAVFDTARGMTEQCALGQAKMRAFLQNIPEVNRAVMSLRLSLYSDLCTKWNSKPGFLLQAHSR